MNDFIVKEGLVANGSIKGNTGTVTGNATLDLSTGDAFEVTPTADVTFAFSNPPAAGNAQAFSVALTGVEVGGYDIANATYDNVTLSPAQDTVYAFYLRNDGVKLYITGASTTTVYQYTLSTPWDISTASYDSLSFSVSSQSTVPTGIFFKDDGLRMYVSDFSTMLVFQYSLSSAWDISTASYDNVSFTASIAGAGSATNLGFYDDGSKFLLTYRGGDIVALFTLSTPWDISTASFYSSFTTTAQSGLPVAGCMNADGSKLFVIEYSTGVMFQYSLSSPYDVSTASYDNIPYSTGSTSALAAFFKVDGEKLYTSSAFFGIRQHSTGTLAPATITYPASVQWSGGTAPASPALGETDLLTFYTEDGGNTYYGFKVGDALA